MVSLAVVYQASLTIFGTYNLLKKVVSIGGSEMKMNRLEVMLLILAMLWVKKI
jgi:hypothetical protein